MGCCCAVRGHGRFQLQRSIQYTATSAGDGSSPEPRVRCGVCLAILFDRIRPLVLTLRHSPPVGQAATAVIVTAAAAAPPELPPARDVRAGARTSASFAMTSRLHN